MQIGYCAHKADGLRSAYAVAEEGFPVLLLHGWPQTAYAWRKVIPLLAGRFRVYAPDLRGFGASSKPDTGYDKKAVATDLAGLMEALGHERFAVVGHDMGGQVAYPLAAMYPDRIVAMAFIESGLPGFGRPVDRQPQAQQARIAYDVANAVYFGEDPLQAIARHAQRIGQYHMSNTTRSAWRHDPPGRGEAPLGAIARAIDESAFSGAAILEIISDDPIAHLGEAVAALTA